MRGSCSRASVDSIRKGGSQHGFACGVWKWSPELHADPSPWLLSKAARPGKD